MADTKLSALSLGTSAPEYVYGIQGGNSRRYHARQVVNVKDFGAVGDGATDDTSEIQAAIDAAFGAMPDSANGQDNPELNKELYFPPGEYIITAPLYLANTRGARIYGAGNSTSRISFKGDGNEGNTMGADPDITPLWMLDGCMDIEFSELGFYGSRNTTLPYTSRTTNNTTASGNGTLHFASTTYIKEGMWVYNYSDPDTIPSGTRVSGTPGANDVVMTQNAAGGGVANGDSMMFISPIVGFYVYESGDYGLTKNITWRNSNMAALGVGIFVGGTTGCANGIIEHCQFNTSCALACLRLENPEATNWAVYGGGTSQCALGTTYQPSLGTQGNHGASFSVVDGQISVLTNMSTSCGNSVTANELSNGGWGIVNAGGKPMSVLGGRMENFLGFATVDSDMFVASVVFGSGSATLGTWNLDATFGGKITCENVQFASDTTVGVDGRMCALGDSGILVMRECTMDNQAQYLEITGSAAATVSIINSLAGSSVPTIANLFASFTGRVVDLQPDCHGVTYATLPTANAKYQGLKGWITDCNTTTYNANAAGGGSSIVPVFCNGTNWKVG